MLRRAVFTAEQEEFRRLIREFTEREIVPRYGDWEQAGEVPRSFFRKLGEIGVMGMAVPEKYGGSGDPDSRYNVILQEEASRSPCPRPRTSSAARSAGRARACG